MKNLNKIWPLLVIISLLMLGLNGMAQEAEQAAETAPPAQPAFQITLATIIYMFVFLLIVIALAVWKISSHIKEYIRMEHAGKELPKKPSIWSKFLQIKPTTTDKDTMIDHPHDGIYELDNPAPPWFMFLFYGTIAIAFVYVIRYSFTESGLTQEQEYAEEMKLAEGAQATRLATVGSSVDENSVTYLADAAELEKGKAIYDGNCKICHGDYGQGAVGPNFTDDYFLHGGDIKDIFKVIKYGVVEKGMISWESQMGAESMQKVASYVKSLQGTTPPVKGKDPQGELYKPKTEAAPADSTAK